MFSNKNSVDDEFDDIFDISDDALDTLEYTDEELNRFFLSGHLPSMISEEETMDDDSFKDDDAVVVVEVKSFFFFLTRKFK